jgi:hypothetical protein
MIKLKKKTHKKSNVKVFFLKKKVRQEGLSVLACVRALKISPNIWAWDRPTLLGHIYLFFHKRCPILKKENEKKQVMRQLFGRMRHPLLCST